MGKRLSLVSLVGVVVLLVGVLIFGEMLGTTGRGWMIISPGVSPAWAEEEEDVILALWPRRGREEEEKKEEKKEVAPAVMDTVLAEQVRELSTRMASFQTEVSKRVQYLNNQYAELGDRIALLNEGLNRFEGRLKSVEDEVLAGTVPGGDLSGAIAALSAELDSLRGRVKVLETVAAAPAPKEKPPTVRPSEAVPPGFRVAPYEPKAAYETALNDYYARKYDQALGEFTEVLTMRPESNLADNAQYWIGECYYALGNYRQALVEFQKVFSYPKTDKADDAQVKIGFCYVRLGDKGRALKAFKKALTDYPDSEYVKVVKARIESLEKG